MSHLSDSPQWRHLTNQSEFDQVIEKSKTKPVLILKYKPNTRESEQVKDHLDSNWVMKAEDLDLFLVDVAKNPEVASEIADVAGVEDESPQVLLFADGVTMYDESHELINVKKIKIALKIISRTFKWMETRV